MLPPLFLLLAVHGSWQLQPPVFPDLPTVKDLAKAAGYSATDIEVITEDGYSIWMHRIGNSSGPPVMLQHGLLTAGDSWITRGADKDLAFLLLKAGFDVWLTNQRGTVYNQYNLKLSRTDPRFWDFSFHEAGYYDIPAFIDSILRIRKAKKLFYIGYSLGTAIFLITTSLRPEYNSKILGATLLSPVAFSPGNDQYGANPFFRYVLNNADAIYAGLLNRKIYELLPRTTSNIRTMKQACGKLSASQDLCLDIIGITFGEHRANIDKENLGTLLGYGFSGTSSKNLYHLSQVYRSGEFKQFDYGREGNLLNYNNPTPPSYPLERIVAPVSLFWSYNDPFLSQDSIQKLASKLPNVIKVQAVPDPKFSHLDMIWGENSKYILYPDVIDIFQSLIGKNKTLTERNL